MSQQSLKWRTKVSGLGQTLHLHNKGITSYRPTCNKKPAVACIKEMLPYVWIVQKKKLYPYQSTNQLERISSTSNH